MNKARKKISTNSIVFYEEDAALLDWIVRRGEKFSGFTKRVLQEAMDAENGTNPNSLPEIIRVIVREELSNATLMTGVTPDIQTEDEITDTSLEERILAF